MYPKVKTFVLSLNWMKHCLKTSKPNAAINQILKNLLSNSFKFTEKGEVKLQIYEAKRNWKQTTTSLDNAKKVVAFRNQGYRYWNFQRKTKYHF